MRKDVYNDIFDVRLAGIELWKDGSLELGFDYGNAHTKDGTKLNNEKSDQKRLYSNSGIHSR